MKSEIPRFLKIACVIGALLVVSGCSPARGSASPSPLQLDTAQMMETAASEAPQKDSETLRERLNAPETYRYEGTSGIVTLSIDAPVRIPDADTVAVVRTSGIDFSQEKIDALLSLLWQNDAMWDNNPPLTRVQIEEQIASIEHNLETLPDYQAEREYFETVRLPELREQLKSAPETAGPVLSSGKLSIEEIPDGRTDRVVASVTQLSIHSDTGRYFSVRNNPDNTVVLENTRYGRLDVRKWAMLDYQSNSDGPCYDSVMTAFSATEVAPEDQTVPAAANGSVSQTPAEAAAIAERFFKALDEDVSIRDLFLFCGGDQGAYLIRCVRNVQGVACILTDGESTSLYSESGDEELPDAVWAGEAITLVVNESGVYQFDWDSPQALGETVVENCKLLPFSEIMDVCVRMLPLVFDEKWGHIDDMTSAAIRIDRIEFGMMRIVRNQSIDEGLMVPVWAFYGSEPFESASLGSQNQPQKQSARQLVINAIDGTVVG